ncbi:MAG: tyrosine-type recombinase/integrase [Phycisphaerales bacterium]|nr:MAG: tyrosine-type recombinase/integrase [Phycisphaerales bacterium]
MATEKVGIYRRWLGPAPLENGKPIPKAQWPKKRRYSWTVRWFGTNGKRYSKDFKTKKLAEQHARKLESKIEARNHDRPIRITLADFSREHIKLMMGQVAYATLMDQKRALRLFEKFIGGLVRLKEIQPRRAEAFIAERLASGLAVGTINKDIRTLRRIFNLAIDPRGYLGENQNPFSRIKQRKKAQKKIRYVSTEEYRLLPAATPRLWWRALMSIAYGSGLRRGEILNLTWADINFENQRIHVQTKASSRSLIEWEPKDHENRVVPMSAESTQLLANIQAESKEGFPYIFISPKRFKRIKQREKEGRWNPRSDTVNNIGRDFNVIRRRSGTAQCTIHDLRRSAITNWAQRLPIQVVQQLAGHSNIATTKKYYLAVRPEDIDLANKITNEILESANTD